MKELKKRNNQIDVARGIAILIVILGHSFYSLDVPGGCCIMNKVES